MDSVNGTRAPVTLPRPSSSSSKAPSFPGREDCWSEDATFTLIGAWGERHVILNRGNLRQKHWEEVADAVNGRHFTASNPKSHRTDVQCKNRVDTLKKKYKIEKARVSDSNGAYTSSWPFFSHLDSLIGDKFPKPSPPPPPLSARYRNPPSPPLPWTVPVAPRSATVKRPAPSPATFPAAGGDALPNRNLDFSAFAAVAAAAAAAEAEDSEDSEGSRSESRSRWSMGWCRSKEREREGGYMELALAIERFAEIYERTETTKLRQMEEMEEKRLRTARELDFQRRQHLEEAVRNFKRAKRSPSSGRQLFIANVVQQFSASVGGLILKGIDQF